MNKKELLILIFLLSLTFTLFLLLANSSKAEIIIYDNITPSNFKYITLEEFSIYLIDDYKYEVLLNGYFIGYYAKNEKIFIPDNSNITIIIPSPIKTSTDDIWNTSIKPQLFTFIGFLLSWGFGLLIIIFLIGYIGYRVYRKIKKGY